MKKTNAGRPTRPIKEYFITATKKLNTTEDELLQLGANEDHNNKEGRPTNSCNTGANIQITPNISKVRSNKENESLKHKTTGSVNRPSLSILAKHYFPNEMYIDFTV